MNLVTFFTFLRSVGGQISQEPYIPTWYLLFDESVAQNGPWGHSATVVTLPVDHTYWWIGCVLGFIVGWTVYFQLKRRGES